MTRRRFALSVIGLFVAMLAVDAGTAFGYQGQAGDTVEGAIWRIQMTSRARRGKKLGGMFRVSDHVLYQKVEPGPDAEEQVVGKNRPVRSRDGKTTLLDFENLRVREPGERPKEGEKISGTAKIERDEFGKFHGRLVDGKGLHWDVTLTRFKE